MLIVSSLIPNAALPTTSPLLSYDIHLDNLQRPPHPISPLTPLRPIDNVIASQLPTKSTHVMAILNLTPDSFSDGGLHSPSNPEAVLQTVRTLLTQHKPPSILDVGGQSTRPHAPEATAEEELSRILPTIKAIRSDSSFSELAISVDTYRASVAEAAIEAGADIVNDVSAGLLDSDMLPTIAKRECTCILMHMRGNPETMHRRTDYPNGVIEGVGSELLKRVERAEKAGVRRWRIILDPGIGFAKNQAQNLELLRRFEELRDFEGLRGFPWLVGASRKGFIGKITGVEEASDRKWGTAACIAAAVQTGADIVRVHDVEEMGQVVKMADALWRA